MKNKWLIIKKITQTDHNIDSIVNHWVNLCKMFHINKVYIINKQTEKPSLKMTLRNLKDSFTKIITD